MRLSILVLFVSLVASTGGFAEDYRSGATFVPLVTDPNGRVYGNWIKVGPEVVVLQEKVQKLEKQVEDFKSILNALLDVSDLKDEVTEQLQRNTEPKELKSLK